MFLRIFAMVTNKSLFPQLRVPRHGRTFRDRNRVRCTLSAEAATALAAAEFERCSIVVLVFRILVIILISWLLLMVIFWKLFVITLFFRSWTDLVIAVRDRCSGTAFGRNH